MRFEYQIHTFYAYIAHICSKGVEQPLEVWFSVDIIEL